MLWMLVAQARSATEPQYQLIVIMGLVAGLGDSLEPQPENHRALITREAMMSALGRWRRFESNQACNLAVPSLPPTSRNSQPNVPGARVERTAMNSANARFCSSRCHADSQNCHEIEKIDSRQW